MLEYFTNMFFSRKSYNYVESFENDKKVLAIRMVFYTIYFVACINVISFSFWIRINRYFDKQ